MKLYHVTIGHSTEIEVIKELKPPRLLLSYYYFKNKPLKDLCEFLGYKPEIMLDSGAYSAWNKGKGIALTDYIKYIEDNKDYIDIFFALDVMDDSLISYRYWQLMKEKGLAAIPVFHYGEDENIFKLYAAETDYIALGGTVPIRDKNAVAEWARMLIWQYPEIKFHMLGTSCKTVIGSCDLESADSSTWYMCAVMGKPKTIKGRTKEAKIQRAKFNMQKELNLYGDG